MRRRSKDAPTFEIRGLNVEPANHARDSHLDLNVAHDRGEEFAGQKPIFGGGEAIEGVIELVRFCHGTSAKASRELLLQRFELRGV
jgi:hypothetical protein